MRERRGAGKRREDRERYKEVEEEGCSGREGGREGGVGVNRRGLVNCRVHEESGKHHGAKAPADDSSRRSSQGQVPEPAEGRAKQDSMQHTEEDSVPGDRISASTSPCLRVRITRF